MTLFIFYNSWPSSKTCGFFLYILLQCLICVLEFHFCLDLKWHCLHFTTISTFLWNLVCFLKFVFCLNLKWHILQIFWPSSKASSPIFNWVVVISYVCTKVPVLCLNLKWCCLHFTTILTFLLSRCRWIYLWSCWEELIVAALEGRFSNFYVCTKVFFFDVYKIALYAYFITQVDLPQVTHKPVFSVAALAWEPIV